MKIIGLDSGSTTTKGVLFSDDQLVAKALTLTQGDPQKAAAQIVTFLDKDDKTRIITTGYGRNLLTCDKAVTEITCHAKGAAYLSQGIENVIDIGGQDSKVIRMTPNGQVLDFTMNDKCAAGTGRFLEVLMHTLGEKIETLDAFVNESDPVKINSMCTVFAESEVISLIGKGVTKEAIALGVLHSIASRISNQFRTIHPAEGPVFFSGGLAHSQQMRQLLSEYTNKKVIFSQTLSQYAGAIGAALIGRKKKA